MYTGPPPAPPHKATYWNELCVDARPGAPLLSSTREGARCHFALAILRTRLACSLDSTPEQSATSSAKTVRTASTAVEFDE